MHFLNKKTAVVAAVLAGILAISGVAYAYFTTTGAGSGTGTVGTSSQVVLTGTVADLLYPGGPSSDVSFTVLNNSPGHQFVTTIHLDSITPDAAHSACNTALTVFHMPDVNASQDFGPSASAQAVTAIGHLTMDNLGVPQDNCKNAVLTLTLSSL